MIRAQYAATIRSSIEDQQEKNVRSKIEELLRPR